MTRQDQQAPGRREKGPEMTNVFEAREAWLTSPARHGYWDSDDDALRDAFAAGWNAALPAIRGASFGDISHNMAQLPDPLVLTIHALEDVTGRNIEIRISEDELITALRRIGVGLT